MATEFFEEDDIWVEARPTGKNSMAFFVFVNSPFISEPMVFEVSFDLGFGAEVRRAM